jgi:hypothetical protein
MVGTYNDKKISMSKLKNITFSSNWLKYKIAMKTVCVQIRITKNNIPMAVLEFVRTKEILSRWR